MYWCLDVWLDVKGIDSEHMISALNAAALKGHVDIVRILLAAGADLSEKDGNGSAAVHSAVIEYVILSC